MCVYMHAYNFSVERNLWRAQVCLTRNTLWCIKRKMELGEKSTCLNPSLNKQHVRIAFFLSKGFWVRCLKWREGIYIPVVTVLLWLTTPRATLPVSYLFLNAIGLTLMDTASYTLITHHISYCKWGGRNTGLCEKSFPLTLIGHNNYRSVGIINLSYSYLIKCL